MLAKLFQKNTNQPPSPSSKVKAILRAEYINPRVDVHYGIPSSSSVLAFDPVQSLLAIGTMDGRIKVIGGDNVEGLIVSPKQLPFKNLEFLINQGFLVSITSENEIQVWDLEQRQLTSTLRWESNITAFSVICGSSYMYVGDEFGMIYVLKYDFEGAKLIHLPYYVPTDAISEASGTSSSDKHSVVGLLPQPSSQGNRLLIAYNDGLIVLWDVSEDKVILTKGNKDLQLKTKTMADFHKGTGPQLSDNISDYEHAEKEISALCWTSMSGSVLAVGYVDGDIMLWNLSTAAADGKSEKSSSDVVKLQLSTADRRLPVIILHWSANSSHNDCCGQLFVYGGDAIGSEEVLTILSIDWSSGLGSLKCTGRVDLTLNGSFADMVVLSSHSERKSKGTLVLTNPGQLHFYDEACFASLMSEQHKQQKFVSSMQYPMLIPVVEPYMTAGKLVLVSKDGKFSKELSKKIMSGKVQAVHAQSTMNWPLTGGIPCQPLDAENYQVERLYIAGYQDGSFRIWDATCATFSLLDVVVPEVKGIDIADPGAPISALEFCSFTLSLAIGNEIGMVRLYKLVGSKTETSLTFVKETEKEVHTLPHGDGPQCAAIFSLFSSPISTLKFANFGTRLAVGFHCGKVAMLDLSTLSVLFVTDSLSNSGTPVKFMALKSLSDSITSASNPEHIESTSNANHPKSEVLIMTKDAHFFSIEGKTGSVVNSQSLQNQKELTVVSVHLIDVENSISDMSTYSPRTSKNSETRSEPHLGNTPPKLDTEVSAQTLNPGQRPDNLLLLLCCEDTLHLYSLKSLKEGDRNPIRKVDLSKQCCWTATFKKDNKECGLMVLYQTGLIEIRSLSNFEVVGETSLASILRWNFKTNMERTICSCDSAEIMLVNACEFASVSLMAYNNNSRNPDSLPCLHDKVLAAAADATIILSPAERKTQGPVTGIIGGFIKGLQKGQVEESVDIPDVSNNKYPHLETVFSNPPYLKPSLGVPNSDGVIELNIDDLQIDEPLIISPLPATTVKKDTKDKGIEREKLFQGGSSDATPKPRTADEIKAKYRKEDPAAAAARARDKLNERGEKLSRLNDRTEELQNGAQNFASMASELAKQMEKRKWWNI
ncbi:transducin family protein / WD-40 repeat family protein [Euphorbia peplus]|nr:transducin family protein / WD-40 repeat family protein [Euphorbia peplus]